MGRAVGSIGLTPFPAVFRILFFFPWGGGVEDGGGVVLGVGVGFVGRAAWFAGLFT